MQFQNGLSTRHLRNVASLLHVHHCNYGVTSTKARYNRRVSTSRALGKAAAQALIKRRLLGTDERRKIGATPVEHSLNPFCHIVTRTL
ncbi:hypothetical protein M378DRAFT_170101 [Amanita muscaria Koide BX008]|uniref:Uncharacterized protein n=1 Tax=Amanita muscaria (strain Koide BX008) TaxID=946122 RepID=A0A0C2WQ41_AMAMK|nr:hypothetical protein M378DRAFT_170101 [Amanita muscaria Koide BX008]